MFTFYKRNKVKRKLSKTLNPIDIRKKVIPTKVRVHTNGKLYFGIFFREYYKVMQKRMVKHSDYKIDYITKQSHAAKLFRYNKIFNIKSVEDVVNYYDRNSNYVSRYYDRLINDSFMKVLCNETRPSIPKNYITHVYFNLFNPLGDYVQALFYDQDRYVVLYDGKEFGFYKKSCIFLDSNLTIPCYNGNQFLYENEFAIQNPELYQKYLKWFNGN